MMTDEQSAAKTLNTIREGAVQTLTNVRMRMDEATRALERGEFNGAAAHLAEAQGALLPLANAESYLAIAGESYLLRVSELKVGMTLANIGEITDIEKEPCPTHGEDHHIVVHVGERLMPVMGDVLMYVEKDRSE